MIKKIEMLEKLDWILTQIKYINQIITMKRTNQPELISHLKYLKGLLNNYIGAT